MSEKRLKILIVGTGDLRNYGCEAIVHGTVEILHRYIPNAVIDTASEDILYDKTVLPKSITPRKSQQRITPYRLYKGVLRRVFGIGNGSVVHIKPRIGCGYDVVLSAGGDNYCQVGDKILTLLEDLMEIGRRTRRSGGLYVLWGASVGPFSNPSIRERVFNNLRLANLITVREERSKQYLDTFADKYNLNVHLVGDPAFCMKPLPYDLKRQNGKVYIGINISLLALSHCGMDCGDELQQFATRLILLQQRHPDWVYVGVPHVQQQGMDSQNDFVALNVIKEAFNDKEKFFNLPPGLGARKTKGAIGNLDVLVAARMHCCVGGISSAVPTLFLTYSPKGVGMANYAYAHNEYDMPCTQINDERFDLLIERIVEKRRDISQRLQSQLSRFEDDAMMGGELVDNQVFN